MQYLWGCGSRGCISLTPLNYASIAAIANCDLIVCQSHMLNWFLFFYQMGQITALLSRGLAERRRIRAGG